MAAEDAAPGTFSPPGTMGSTAPTGAPSNDDLINWFSQMMMSGGMGGGAPGGGGMGAFPPGQISGGNPLLDALGIGGAGMGDALGQGGLINPMGGVGLNPYQAAKLRVLRRGKESELTQDLANKHLGTGRFGGRNYATHVDAINDLVLARQEQMVQDNVKNALAYNQQLQQYGQQNLANNQKLMAALGTMFGNQFRYGGAGEGQGAAESPGTYSGGEEQGTLP